MSFWNALVEEGERAYTLPLLIGLFATVVIVRLLDPRGRHRLGTMTFLVMVHLTLILAAAAIHSTQTTNARDLRVIALIVSAVATIAMLSAAVGAVLNRGGAHVPGIVRDVVAGVITLIAVFVIAARMDVEISGVVATSAVVTYIIGVALQDPLGNLVAGLALQTDDSLGIGDWVKIGDNSGILREFRWRYSILETRNFETVLIPNSQLVKGPVLIEGRAVGHPREWRRWVWFNVDFRTAPTDVLQIVQEALHDISIEHVASDPAPQCVLMELGESYAKYAVRYWLTDPRYDDPTDSVIRTHVYFALKRAGIPPPMPAMAAFVTQESSDRAAHKEQVEHQRRLDALHKIALFDSLSQDACDRLASGLRPAPFAPGEVMTRQGAVAHWLYLVVSGEAKVLTSSDGAPPLEVARLKAGDFFGEMSLLTGQPREATVIAVTYVDCYRLDRAVAHDVLTRDPAAAEKLAERLAERQVALQHAREDFDKATQASRVSAAKSDILGRIRKFFGLDGTDEDAAGT